MNATIRRRYDHRQRLGRAILYLRNRYYHYGRHHTLALLTSLERRLKNFDARMKLLADVQWIAADEYTTYEDALYEAARQGLRFGALDTEYYVDCDKARGMGKSGGTGKTIATEVGFSYVENGEIKSSHYVIGGGKAKQNQRKFRYGESQRYPLHSQVAPYLKQLYNKVDVILVWDGGADLRALHNMKSIPPKHKVLDVAQWQMRPPPAGSYNGYNLAEFCHIQGVDHLDPHNAGNDARVLLEATLMGMGILGDTVELEEL